MSNEEIVAAMASYFFIIIFNILYHKSKLYFLFLFLNSINPYINCAILNLKAPKTAVKPKNQYNAAFEILPSSRRELASKWHKRADQINIAVIIICPNVFLFFTLPP